MTTRLLIVISNNFSPLCTDAIIIVIEPLARNRLGITSDHLRIKRAVSDASETDQKHNPIARVLQSQNDDQVGAM